MVEKWIPKKGDIKKDALRKQLQIPKEKRIPDTLLLEINKSDVGDTADNPTLTGKQKVPVTKLLKKRVSLAMTFRRIRKHKPKPRKWGK